MLQKIFLSLLSHELQTPCGHSVQEPLTKSSRKLAGGNIQLCVSVRILCSSYKSEYTALINFNLHITKLLLCILKQRGGTDSGGHMRMVLIHFLFVEETLGFSQLALSLGH